MKFLKQILIIGITAIIVASGTYAWLSHKQIPAPVTPSAQASDPYTEWQLIPIADAATIMVPPGYRANAGAGSMYFIKPTSANPTPTPDFVVSTDGEHISIKRWENQGWQYWDQMIASIRVKTPLSHPLNITIDQ